MLMKQGIVMEIKSKKAIVFTKEGAFETVSLKKGQHVEIGSEIEVPVSKSYYTSYKKRISTIVAAAAVLVLFFTQYPFLQNSNVAVAAYVGLDINPSIEVGVNEKLKVVEVIPINDDGKIIVEQIDDDYRNKPLSEFIDDTIELAKSDGYLTENKDVLLTITTIDKDAQAEIEEKVNAIKEETEKKGMAVTTLEGDENTRKEAKDLGVSTGKYMIYKESKEELTIEETKELSVTQIYEKIDKSKKQKEEKDSKIEKNNNQKMDLENKKEQKAEMKQQKFEDKKKENLNKNKEGHPGNEPPGKNKVKENNGNNGRADKNKSDDNPPGDGNWNNKIKESDDEMSSKNKKDDFEKHEDQQKSNKYKKDDKDKHQNENNGNKKEN